MMARGRPRRRSVRRVLIIVQNLPVPFDRRVWLEALALRDAGYGVAVICPKAPGDPAFEEREGIRIRKYTPPPAARGLISYAWEFAYCWLRSAALMLREARSEGFDAVQACNPPDTYWALVAPLKLVGKRFVFDQHDLCPEVYASRFSSPSPFVSRALRMLERATYAAADHVVVTNESYRAVALDRGRVPNDHVTVVRTGPDPDRLRRGTPNPSWRHGCRYLCAYLGVMGPQDGVDLALRAAAVLLQEHRSDVHFVFMGSGDSLDELKSLSRELGIAQNVTFTGRVPDETVFEVLSTAHIGLCPGPVERAERCLDDEQDHGVHGFRASGRRVRSQRNEGLSGRGRSICPSERRPRVCSHDRQPSR